MNGQLTNTPLFQVQLHGGPKDGLSAEVSSLPSRTVFMPSSGSGAINSSTGRLSTADVRAAKYCLSRAHYNLAADRPPVLELHYEFWGVERCRRHSRLGRFTTRVVNSLGLSDLVSGKADFRGRLKGWMLEPINYPFKIEPQPSPREASDSDCAA